MSRGLVTGGVLFVFVLEVLMGTFSFTVMIPALACCPNHGDGRLGGAWQ
ncbi:hypothetical protein [Sodalis sp.]